MSTAAIGNLETCSYRYGTDAERRCPYPAFFAELRGHLAHGKSDGLPGDCALNLPTDAQHFCLFHSGDAEWKAAHVFCERFRQLLRLIDWHLRLRPSQLLQEDRIDCRGFVFVKPSGGRLIDLSHLSVAHKLDLVEATFRDAADFQGSRFGQSAYFEDAHFLSYAHFIDCHFDGNAYFDRCVFDDYAVFRRTRFNGVTSFDRTSFSTHSTSYFEELSVGKSLVFKGTLEKKLLPGPWVLTLAADGGGDGGISFENVALNHLDRPSLQGLRALEKSGKVQILAGCDRHRVTKELLIPYRKKYEMLIADIAQAFTEVFNFEGWLKVTIGVEIEYLDDTILVRYFSDADITQGQFGEVLQRAVPLFFRFLKSPEQCLTFPVTFAQWDLFRRLKVAQFGLASRVGFDREWKETDTDTLLGAQPGPFATGTVLELHEHLTTAIINVAPNAHSSLTLTEHGDVTSSQTIMGDHNEQHITGGTFYGPVAMIMRDCRNTIKLKAAGERRQLLEALQTQIGNVLDGPEEEKAQLKKMAAGRLKELTEGVATGSPDRAWYSVSAKGLLEAASFVKDFSAEIAGTLTNLGKQFWPDFTL